MQKILNILTLPPMRSVFILRTRTRCGDDHYLSITSAQCYNILARHYTCKNNKKKTPKKTNSKFKCSVALCWGCLARLGYFKHSGFWGCGLKCLIASFLLSLTTITCLHDWNGGLFSFHCQSNRLITFLRKSRLVLIKYKIPISLQ